MPLPEGQVLYFSADTLDWDILLLDGLDLMRLHGLITGFHTGTMQRGQYQWSLPMKYFKGMHS